MARSVDARLLELGGGADLALGEGADLALGEGADLALSGGADRALGGGADLRGGADLALGGDDAQGVWVQGVWLPTGSDAGLALGVEP